MSPLLPLVKVFLKSGGPLSPFTRSPAASLRVLHRPGQSQRAGRRVLVGCWWVGYNSSPERDGSLISVPPQACLSSALCTKKGFVGVYLLLLFASPLCELQSIRFNNAAFSGLTTKAASAAPRVSNKETGSS